MPNRFIIINFSAKHLIHQIKSIKYVIDLTQPTPLSPSHGGEFDHRIPEVYNLAPSYIHWYRGCRVPLRYKNISTYFETLDQLFLFKEFYPCPIPKANYLFKEERSYEFIYYISKEHGVQYLTDPEEINNMYQREFEEWVMRNEERRRSFFKTAEIIKDFKEQHSVCILSDTHETTTTLNIKKLHTPEICLIKMLVNYS